MGIGTGDIVFAAFIGIPLAISLALMIVSALLNASNNFGDYSGTVASYSKFSHVSEDSCSKHDKPDPITNQVILDNMKKKVKPAYDPEIDD